MAHCLLGRVTLFSPPLSTSACCSLGGWGSPGAVQTCRAELCVEEKEVLVVLGGAVWAFGSQLPRGWSTQCVQCVFQDIQKCCSCVWGTCTWWEWFANVLSECRRINFVETLQHCWCLLQFIRASLQVTHRVLWFEWVKMHLCFWLEWICPAQQSCSKKCGCVHDHKTLAQSKHCHFPLGDWSWVITLTQLSDICSLAFFIDLIHQELWHCKVLTWYKLEGWSRWPLKAPFKTKTILWFCAL